MARQPAPRSPAATSPSPIRWRSARSLEVRPSPARRAAQRSTSPGPAPPPVRSAAAFGSPAESDLPAQPEAAVPATSAAGQPDASQQTSPAPATEEPAEQGPEGPAVGDGASGNSLPPDVAPAGSTAERVLHGGRPAGLPASSPPPAGLTARGRSVQQRMRNAGQTVEAGATPTRRSSGATRGRRSLSAPSMAVVRAELPRWQR